MDFVLPFAVSPLGSWVKQNLLIMETLKQASSAAAGRLSARPTPPTAAGSPELHLLRLEGKRDGLLYVPTVTPFCRLIDAAVGLSHRCNKRVTRCFIENLMGRTPYQKRSFEKASPGLQLEY